MTDRGYVNIDLASVSNPSERVAVEILFGVLGYDKERFEGVEESQFKDLAGVLETEFQRIKVMLSPSNLLETQKKIDEFDRLYRQKHFPSG